jgi:hypothetical protein
VQTLPKHDGAVNIAGQAARKPPAYRHVKGDARETIIRLDHDLKVAEVWTMRRRLLGRLKRLGGEVLDKAGPGVWVRLPERAIRFRNPHKKAVSATTRARLARLSAARAGRGPSGEDPCRNPGSQGGSQTSGASPADTPVTGSDVA